MVIIQKSFEWIIKYNKKFENQSSTFSQYFSTATVLTILLCSRCVDSRAPGGGRRGPSIPVPHKSLEHKPI
jgi:hypothetical protein